MKHLRNSTGEAYIDVVIKFMIFMLLIAFLISIVPIFLYKIEQDNFADGIVRVAELSGNTNSLEVRNKVTTLEAKTGIHPSVDWGGTDYQSSTRVQLNSNISLELKSVYTYKLATFLPFDIEIKSRANGTSEQFWK